MKVCGEVEEKLTQGKYQRINYHSKSFIARSTYDRINLLRANLDFSKKVLLDLGCSGGFISESFPEAKKVFAIDADEELIEINRERVKEKSDNNVEYITDNILKLEKIRDEKIDIILMLSVIHHLFNGSQAYSWNKSNSLNRVIKKLKKLTKLCNTFVVEMGMPFEGYDWCTDLPYNQKNCVEWFFENVFDQYWEYKLISNNNLLNRLIIHPLLKRFPHGSKGFSFMKSLLGKDIRDLRPIYIFKKIK